MAPAEGDAPKARTQGRGDAQERANQSGDASKASESRRKQGDNGEEHVDADGDEVMASASVDAEAKENDERLNSDSAASSRLNAVSISSKGGFSHIPQLLLHHFSAEVTSTRSRLNTLHSPQYQFT
ncbi:hypothetical protein PHYSODRAFT_324222 [Phytophthora sojae]|uniref:Uncharacterized protein n=1 Tax=Phytophthora sojae (strain P6497) TaxID=1094619 RepID=G4YRX0_PHYSP|nr:hypothetical protein PHYSODRAFT_324222 [Phytophthora sojae]EGZ22947.1 hypothetical protein PHYSODRAFT_324222 [Phytophthora sojae]|eukprot:XP_009518235.1 hypothetical protein PHYSODRAFT_324222 [Phytophthora sojae]